MPRSFLPTRYEMLEDRLFIPMNASVDPYAAAIPEPEESLHPYTGSHDRVFGGRRAIQTSELATVLPDASEPGPFIHSRLIPVASTRRF